MGSTRNRKPSLADTTSDASKTETIKIAVFDNNPIFRAGIVHVLNAEPGMEVVMESGSALDLLELGGGLSPDIIILDADIIAAEMNLWSSIHRICPAVNILAMAFNLDHEQVLAAFAVGARGYILKGVGAPELLEAVRALYRSEGYVSPALGAMMLANASLEGRFKREFKGANASPLAQLTFREGEIFDLLAAGLTNKEIGRHLNVAEKTIKGYVTHIFEKLHVRNRVEAAMLSRSETKPHVARRTWRVVAPPSHVGGKDGSTSVPVTGGLVAGSKGGLPQRRNGQSPNG
jgi:two-component system, NarL family, nitrate/nitrite response regulator NarL